MHRRRRSRPFIASLAIVGLIAAGTFAWRSAPAGAVTVGSEAELRAALADTSEGSIQLNSDVTLTDCKAGQLRRPAGSVALVLEGAGHTIRQTCVGVRVLESQAFNGMTLNRVTITGGNVNGGSSTGFGGGILADGGGPLTLDAVTVTGNRAGGDQGGRGGGIMASGPIIMSASVITDNVAGGGLGDYSGIGGGIAAGNALTVLYSTIGGNSAQGSETSGGLAGGVYGGGTFAFISSTVSGNVATAGKTSGSGRGGGILSNDGLAFVNATVSGNLAQGPDGDIGGFSAARKITMAYTTVAYNAAARTANVPFGGAGLADSSFASVVSNPLGGGTNCTVGKGVASSLGYNYSDDASCAFVNTATGDVQNGADPLLGSLADNGGFTQTLLPGAGSPLRDAIAPSECTAGTLVGGTTDQRDEARPLGTGCDIGAVEVYVEPTATTTTTSTTLTPTSTTVAPTTTASPQQAPAARAVTAQPAYTG